MKAVRIAAAGIAGIWATALGAQPTIPPPASPVIMEAPPPASITRQVRLAERRSVVSMDVEVRGGREVLWSGNLRVSANMSGEYSQSKREAWSACPGDDEGSSRYPNRQNELRVSLNRRYGDNDPDAFAISASWVRPVESCDAGQGSRSVAIAQNLKLSPGSSRELTGDGGLVVRVTRRP